MEISRRPYDYPVAAKPFSCRRPRTNAWNIRQSKFLGLFFDNRFYQCKLP